MAEFLKLTSDEYVNLDWVHSFATKLSGTDWYVIAKVEHNNDPERYVTHLGAFGSQVLAQEALAQLLERAARKAVLE